MANLMKLRELRERMDLTQEQFAEKAGFLAGTYQAYESGRINILPAARKKIEKALGTKDIEWPAVGEKITRADLENLGKDILGEVNHAHLSLDRKITAVGASVQEALKLLRQLQGSPQG